MNGWTINPLRRLGTNFPQVRK